MFDDIIVNLAWNHFSEMHFMQLSLYLIDIITMKAIAWQRTAGARGTGFQVVGAGRPVGAILLLCGSGLRNTQARQGLRNTNVLIAS